GRLLATPQAPFTATTVFTPNGARQPQNLFTANWGGSAANEPLLLYLDPNSSALGGLRTRSGATVDGVKTFAENSALNPFGTGLVSSGMVGLNSRVLVAQNVDQAANPLRSLFSREPMVSDPANFDFFHHMLGGPTKYEWARWEAHNVTLEQTFLEKRAGLEVSLDRQRVDNGFVSPLTYAINLDPNERLPDGAPNPNFLRPLTLGGGFKRVYSQDRTAGRLTGYYALDLRNIGSSDTLGRFLGRHLLNANYARQNFLYQQFGGTIANTALDWRAFESLPLPGTASSTARIVPIAHYLGASVRDLASPSGARIQGLTAPQDPTGTPAMTILTHQRPITNDPAALAPWTPATFDLVTNGRYDVSNTIRNAQRYSDRLAQKVRSASAVLQSHWLDGDVVTTAGWRRDSVSSYDAGIPGQTPEGTADVRWDVFSPQLTRSLSESSGSFGVVGHLPDRVQRRLPLGTDASAFYNYATNFRVAPQRYTITGESLPSETGTARSESGSHFLKARWTSASRAMKRSPTTPSSMASSPGSISSRWSWDKSSPTTSSATTPIIPRASPPSRRGSTARTGARIATPSPSSSHPMPTPCGPPRSSAATPMPPATVARSAASPRSARPATSSNSRSTPRATGASPPTPRPPKPSAPTSRPSFTISFLIPTAVS
ncbi:MAG: hypothetical protein V4773_24405, partial [Verrucomicrobiota bacterium]